MNRYRQIRINNEGNGFKDMVGNFSTKKEYVRGLPYTSLSIHLDYVFDSDIDYIISELNKYKIDLEKAFEERIKIVKG